MIYTLQQKYPSFFFEVLYPANHHAFKSSLCIIYLNILPSKDKFKIDYLKNVLIFSFRVNCPEHDCSSHDMTTHFRRGQSKVYYASEVWDPGEDEEFARTSFRSDCSAVSEQDRSGGGVGQLHHTVSIVKILVLHVYIFKNGGKFAVNSSPHMYSFFCSNFLEHYASSSPKPFI